MADKELEELRAKLLEKGVTAPKSWNKNKLKKELSILEEANTSSEQKASPDEALDDLSESTADNTEQTESTEIDSADENKADLSESTKDNTEQSESTETDSAQDSSADESTEKLAENTEELDDEVLLQATTDFSNPRLGLKGIKTGKKFTVKSADATFLVTVDRTCKYV